MVVEKWQKLELIRIASFVDQRCATAQNDRVSSSDLYAAYIAWSKTLGVFAVAQATLGRRLTALGFKRGRTTNGKRIWLSLCVEQIA